MPMKIREIEPITLAGKEGGSATWASITILVKVVTADGSVGYGEAVPTARPLQVHSAVKQVAKSYVGREVEEIERNSWEWHKQDFYLARSFESTTALSAIDIASWDIVGKEFNAPIYKLLGGSFRRRVRNYANGWYPDCVTSEDFAQKAKRTVNMGYTALKFDPFGEYYDYLDERGLSKAVERVKAVREAVGDDVEILIEHHGRFNPNSAVMAARALEPFNPLFMEEPVHPENMEGLRKYRASTSVRVALGERILSLTEALDYLSQGLVDFLQIDLTNVGGVTQAKKVSAVAEAFGVEMAYHNAFGPIQNAVTLQLDAVIPNFLVQESFYDWFPSWKRELIYDSTPVKEGYSEVPQGPGIGVKVNEKLVEELKVEPREVDFTEEPKWVVKGTWKG